ncbi:MAG: hypothetical protein ABI833_23135 [Acidobacteriota bacterium]
MRFSIIALISLVILLTSVRAAQTPPAGRRGPAAVDPKTVATKPPIPLIPPVRPVNDAPLTPLTASRGLEPDGTVVISLPGGSMKLIYPGGRIEVKHPDGTVEKFGLSSALMQTPENLPPAPPDSSLGFWLKNRNEELLHVIESVVRDDSAIQKYVASEKDITEYQVFRRRLEVVARLVKP